MKIGIDARMYGPEQGGLGRYIEQLLLHLEPLDTADELVVFLRKKNFDSYQPKNPRIQKVLMDIPWYGWREQIFVPRIIKKQNIDLMHFPHWNVPLKYEDPFIVTIHDLLLIHYPTREASTLGPLAYWFKNKMFRRVLDHAAHKAEHILTVSEFSKNDIHSTLGVPLDKIMVTYPAPFAQRITHNAEPVEQSRRLHVPRSTFHSLGITKPYVLYVGNAYPHKNLDTLLKGWKIFQQNYSWNYQLILAGKKNFFYDKLFNNETMKQWNNVTHIDSPTDETLVELYRHASLYVFPSLYEGFGLPPLEAMRYSVPVISSDRTCLVEVLGDAAYYFDPIDPKAIAFALQQGLENQDLRQKLQAASQNVLGRYSWKELAEHTWQLYQSTVDKP